MVSLKSLYWPNSQYSRQKCLDISDIPDKTNQKELGVTVLNISRKLNVAINFSKKGLNV